MQGESVQPDLDELIVVGIGASAGGLEALEAMFENMPAHPGMAFVIVQHLSPDFKSLMVELLGRHTQMAIHRVEDGMLVEVNSLYLIPPKQDMIYQDGRLRLTERAASTTPALPIDHFLISLAAEKGRNSVGVILSGTGSDGSRGVEQIHDAGGLVIVQSPETARFDGMLKSAIDSGRADVVVSPQKIPELLRQYSTHRDRVSLRDELLPVHESSMERIFRLIQQRHRIDFSQYRPTTIGRRIERRIEMAGSIENLKQYADLLESDVVELDQLINDLLIGVTSFFRDFRPFESLKKNAIEKLIAEHPISEEFRVWVAACATGEEAYSVAMLIDECLRETSKKIEVKVFATDIHKNAIAKATTGIYPEELLKKVSSQRLARYFIKVDGGYQIVPEIRQMVVFAPHNLTKDPPFTRLSLVTCRNFLIYLLPKYQSKVISHFHFGLKKHGYLLLGASESPGELSAEFEPVDTQNRLYRKLRDSRLTSPMFTNSQIQASAAVNRHLSIQPTAKVVPRDNPLALTLEEVLSSLVPPGIVVDHTGKVLQVFRNAGKYLQVNDGLLSSNLMDMVEEGLRLAIGGAMQRCSKRGEPVCYERLQIKTAAGETNHVRLMVTPLPHGDVAEKFVVTFEEIHDEPSEDVLVQRAKALDLDEVSKGHLEELERELRRNHEILQATTEEMETSNEELQATNEELVASNEELQSANEELHSVNEELFTVNGEYQRKISELTELTNDFDNLLVSTDIHTLFLDGDLCIRKFTPQMGRVLHLVPRDAGRKIDAFVHNLRCDDLPQKIKNVLETGEHWEERISGGEAVEYLLRVLPYEAAEETSGVVVTLVDISKLAAAQEAVVLERERFKRAIQANRDGIWDWPDLKQPTMWWSPTCYRLLGYQPDAFPAEYSEWLNLIHPDDRQKIERTSLPSSEKCFVELHENFEYRLLHSTGNYRWYCHRAVIDHDEHGKPIRMTGSIADVQDRKTFEMIASEEIRLRDNFLSMLSHELRNPMGAVINAMANLEEDPDVNLDRNGQSELAVITRQTRQMARLLDDLLDVARFGRDKIEFRKEVVDLCEIVDSVIESVDYQLEDKQQKLKTSICEGPLNIIGDPSRIAQAQTNLIVNASKFSKSGQDIGYKIEREDNEAVITVLDDGVGIKPDMLESVFGLFVQSEETLESSPGGMGIGLSLTQKIIRAHNGSVAAKSKGPGQGSRFQIRLPLTALEHEKRPRPKSIDRSLTCKVMLVEDNVDARNMMAKTLRRRNFEVLAIGDGKMAIEKMSEFEPVVAVVDIGLPGISGFEVAQKIRENDSWNNVLLVALTGYGQKEDRDAVMEAGFDHHIVKPLFFDELFEIMVQHIARLDTSDR